MRISIQLCYNHLQPEIVIKKSIVNQTKITFGNFRFITFYPFFNLLLGIGKTFEICDSLFDFFRPIPKLRAAFQIALIFLNKLK